jgi:hypothetical protein
VLTDAVDWDDTLVDPASKDWLPGAKDWLWMSKKRGVKIIIHSCRCNWEEGRQEIRLKLGELGWREDSHYTLHPKPNADRFIDDRNVVFTGWDSTPVLRKPKRRK